MQAASRVTKGYVNEERFFSYARHKLQMVYGFIPFHEWCSMTYPEMCLMLDEIDRTMKNSGGKK